MEKPNEYLFPKELAFAIYSERGLRFTVSRIRAVRTISQQRKDGTFIDGRATVPGLIDWLRMNPDFCQRPGQYAKKRNVSSCIAI